METLNEIERLLTPEFLLRLVAVESIEFRVNAKDSEGLKGLPGNVKLDVMVIEPTSRNGILSENRYTIELFKIEDSEFHFDSAGDSNFEFDTDEVALTKAPVREGGYTLKFSNAATRISVTFLELKLGLVSKREFVDGE